jgi:hypothetical protein
VADLGSNAASVLLQIPVVSISPSALNFGGQQVGTTSSPQTLTVTNTGSAPLNITGVNVVGDFAQTNTCTSPIQTGSKCSMSVTFTPTLGGTRSGTTTIADNAVNSPQTVSLSGLGMIATTTTLSTSLNPSKYGKAVTLTAVIVPALSGTPTGSVKFYDNTTLLGSVPLNKGVADLTISTLLAGSHPLTALYSGDGTYVASTSTVLTQIVGQAAVKINLASTPNPSNVSQSVAFSVVVSGTATPPTGSVEFKQGNKILGTANLVGGDANLRVAFTTAGTFSIVASYSGDPNYLASNSKAVKQVVEKYSTSTSLTSSINPSSHGQPVQFTATVSSGGPLPTGKVIFKNGNTSLGSGNLVNGVAMITTPKLPSGSLSITATYDGNSETAKSTSPILIQVVD